MTATPHLGETLSEYLDGRLTEAQAVEVRAHLETCASCRALHDDLATARGVLRAWRPEPDLPADLPAAITRALDAEARRGLDAASRSTAVDADVLTPGVIPSPDAIAAWARTRRRRWLAAGAVAAALVAYVVGRDPQAPLDLPGTAARDFAAVGSRSLPLAVVTTEAGALEAYFSRTDGPRVRVIDLAMMDITLEGGQRHTLAGHPSALYSYRTPTGARLVCQMYEGRLVDLPTTSDTHIANGFTFQVYTRGAVTLVFWQEGDLVCVIASEQPRAEVLALAVAKAMAPA